jgi:hypothetical protein
MKMSDVNDELVEYAKKLASGHATEGETNRVRSIGAALLKSAEVPPVVVPVVAGPEVVASVPAPKDKASKTPKGKK